jgi:hypothetical protein
MRNKITLPKNVGKSLSFKETGAAFAQSMRKLTNLWIHGVGNSYL